MSLAVSERLVTILSLRLWRLRAFGGCDWHITANGGCDRDLVSAVDLGHWRERMSGCFCLMTGRRYDINWMFRPVGGLNEGFGYLTGVTWYLFRRVAVGFGNWFLLSISAVHVLGSRHDHHHHHIVQHT